VQEADASGLCRGASAAAICIRAGGQAIFTPANLQQTGVAEGGELIAGKALAGRCGGDCRWLG